MKSINTDETALLGVDTGGTFTDFVFYNGKTLIVHKVLSTPESPEIAILQGIKDLGLQLDGLMIVHGSTVATNAVLQNRGVKTVYVTNHGFADVLSIGRQTRRDLFDLQPGQIRVPVPAELCLEIEGRCNALGEEVTPVIASDLEQLCARIQQLKPNAVAINMLFSYMNDSHESTIEEFILNKIRSGLLPELFISRSSKVLPECREYERGIATWLNASTGPLVQRYLHLLQKSVQPASVSVMQSAGGTVGVEQAGSHAVQMLLSGPAGGLAGARFVAEKERIDQIMTFDMGGTSSDVALIDRTINLTTSGQIAHWPVAVPMVDMHTIGAGGGSIAQVDAGGLLLVGPKSAGSVPGPACYGNGAVEATVTDANLVLGRILPNAFLGGHLALSVDAARTAVENIAVNLGTDLLGAAEGIVRVANEHMITALRVISVQRGLDPRNFTLVSFGGAGGLHVCALAEALEMTQILIPIYAGVLSALGMLVAPRSRLPSRTVNILLQPSIESDEIEAIYKELLEQGTQELIEEGLVVGDLNSEFLVDMRYQGQSGCLTLGWNHDLACLLESFHQRHASRYGHRLEDEIEIVTLRAQIQGPVIDVNLNAETQVFVNDFAQSVNYDSGVEQEMHILKRSEMKAGKVVSGPALIIEPVATTYIMPGWQCSCQATGNLILKYP